MIGRRRKPLKIALSARIFHPEPDAKGIRTKTLQVLEQSVAQWAMTRDVMLMMVPSVVRDGELMRSNIRLRDYAEYLDGLILQGGADVCPQAYGEQALQPAWMGDSVRDAYELELLHEFIEAGKPVLGICRGMQLINVAFGGSLYQDLPTQRAGELQHETSDYDRHSHTVVFSDDGNFKKWFGAEGGQVSSIHHQAVNRLGRDLKIEATSDDGLVEAISGTGRTFLAGVQWHPEFHFQQGTELLDCGPLLEAFLEAAHRAR
jgi:putative glutamine amidotransferase